MTTFSYKTLFVMALVLSVAACDSQVGSGYNGEPLASLLGTVNSELSQPPPSAQAALAWSVDTGTGDQIVGEYVDVDGTFPSDFRLDLFVPPADEVLYDLSQADPPEDNRLGIAVVIAVKPDADLSDPNIVWESVILGAVERHLVIYLEKDVQPGSLSERYLHGTLSAGYHLMDAVPLTPAEIDVIETCQANAGSAAEYDACGTTFDQLHESSTGFDQRVPLRLVDDLSDLDMAEWS